MSDFDASFDGLAALAFRVAFRILGNHPDSEDVAAETMTRALMRWDKVSREDPTPWVITVAGRLAIDLARTSARRRRRWAGVADRELTTPDPFEAERADLRRALGALSRRQLEVVLLRHVAGLSEADTAAALGISAGTVKTHSSRGLTELRTSLEATP